MDVTQITELEKRILSALMLRDGAAMAEAAEVLKAEDFYRVEHKMIYSAVLRLYAADVPYDCAAITNELEKTGELKRVGQDYLRSLNNLEYTTVRVNYYAKEISEASAKRKLDELGRMLSKCTKSDKTSAEWIALAEEKLTCAVSGTTNLKSASDIANRVLDEICNAKKSQGIKTGLIRLDKITGGLKKSDLIILAARPSMGKTALAMNIALNASINSSTAVFSLEMSESQLMQRMMSTEGRVESTRIQRGELNERELRAVADAAEDISKRKLFIDDTAAISLLELKTRSRRLKREHGLDLIIIDYLQLLQASKEYRGNRVQEVSELSRGLKSLAKELDVPVLALSQLSRAVEQRADKRPLLSDLRESGSIEQDADIVIFLYREEYYNREADDIAEAIVAKNRNGALGTCPLYFDKTIVSFNNLYRRD